MAWVQKGLYGLRQAIDWVADGLAKGTDPNWLTSNPGWAATLVLGLILLVGWFCLFGGGQGR